ncbi:MAG: GNAT family N-acetyltransferase [Pseudomonadota bacterium]
MRAAPTIRPLAPEDRDAWAPLWRGYLAFYGTERDEAQFDLTFARYTEPDRADMLAWLAWDGKAALGLVHVIVHAHGWHAAPVSYLQDLFTTPEARGRGVARALIETVYAHADQAGHAGVYWLTQSGNITAQHLYDRLATKTDFIKYARP